MIHHYKIRIALYSTTVHIFTAPTTDEFLRHAERRKMRKDLYDAFSSALGNPDAEGCSVTYIHGKDCPIAVFLKEDASCPWSELVSHEMTHVAAAMCRDAGLVDWLPNATTEPLAYLVGYLTGKTIEWRNGWKKRNVKRSSSTSSRGRAPASPRSRPTSSRG